MNREVRNAKIIDNIGRILTTIGIFLVISVPCSIEHGSMNLVESCVYFVVGLAVAFIGGFMMKIGEDKRRHAHRIELQRMKEREGYKYTTPTQK